LSFSSSSLIDGIRYWSAAGSRDGYLPPWVRKDYEGFLVFFVPPGKQATAKIQIKSKKIAYFAL